MTDSGIHAANSAISWHSLHVEFENATLLAVLVLLLWLTLVFVFVFALQ